jgi:hypothetical protein
MKGSVTASLLLLVKVASMVIFPDCRDSNQLPSCISGGIIINPASANPILSSNVSGWSYASGPLTNNVAYTLYSAIGPASASIFPELDCQTLSYGDFSNANGTIWFVIELIKSSNGDPAFGAQPLVGVFSNGTSSAACPLIFTLPTGVRGTWYVFTSLDDGSFPEIKSRIKMTNTAFPCDAAASTIVSYILFGTMQLVEGAAAFILRAAGLTTQIPGCNAHYIYKL